MDNQDFINAIKELFIVNAIIIVMLTNETIKQA